jgi:hypothetical protein
MGRIIEGVRGGSVDRDGARFGGRVRFVAWLR